MGQTQNTDNTKNTKYELKVNEELDNIIKEEIKPKNPDKTILKKGTKYLKFSGKGKTKKQLYVKDNESIKNNSDTETSEEEEEKEIYLSYITELVDTIYTKNINMQLKNRPNKTIYETVFDVRNIISTDEDLNNNEYNIKSCEIMNNIIEPDTSDKINLKKDENKNNIDINDNKDNKENLEVNDNKSDEDKDESVDNDFFKNWDYIHDDIFNNDKEENPIEYTLDFYDNEKEKKEINKLKEQKEKEKKEQKELKELKEKETKEQIEQKELKEKEEKKELKEKVENKDKIEKKETKEKKDKINKKKSRRGTETKTKKSNENIEINEDKPNKSLLLFNNKKLILLEDIITNNNKVDMNQINEHINDSINQYKNIIIHEDINNNKETNNKLENKNENVNINDSYNKNFYKKSKTNINKENININMNLPSENFEIINNEDLCNESNVNKTINNNHLYENSSEIIFNNKRKTSDYNKDDEEKDESVNTEKKIIKNLFNDSKIKSKKESSNIFEEKNSFEYNENNNMPNSFLKKNNQINKNSNKSIKPIKPYKKKLIDTSKKNNNKFLINNNSIINPTDNLNENSNINIDINNISDIKKTENLYIATNSNINLKGIYSPKKIRSKTPIIYKPRNKNIPKKKILLNNNINNFNNDLGRTTEFDTNKLTITKTENLDIPKQKKIYISKTPVKHIFKTNKVVKKSNNKKKNNLFTYEYNKDKMDNEINNINKTIEELEKKIKSIEKSEKKSKTKYNMTSKNMNNNNNIRTIKNIGKIAVSIKPKNTKKKKKIHTQKTFDENDIKGYKDRMPLINKKREENNYINYIESPFNRYKSTDIQLKRKKEKKIDNTNKYAKYEHINNYIFGKQNYYNEPNE